MALTTLLMVSAMGASAVSSDAVRWFPGDYFNSRVRSGFHAEVMEGWPGPGQLLRLWSQDRLDEADRVSLLLGGAAFHDPVLLPVYREAARSPSQRVRQAAVYGYRDLIADSLPDVGGGVSDENAKQFGVELDLVIETLAQRSLVELWLQALLASEDLELPGWRGVTLRRTPEVSLRALERLVDVEDLNSLLVAYDGSADFGTRVNLLKLVESVTLSRFIIMPEGAKEGWGRHVFEAALEGMERARDLWSRNGCTVDGEKVLARNLRAMGVTGIDPLSVDGCGLWVGVLDRGYPQWWGFAARRLYDCGGPWVEISTLAPERPPGPDLRMKLIDWFRPLIQGGRSSAAGR